MGVAPQGPAQHPSDRLGRLDRCRLWRARLLASAGVIIGFFIAAIWPWLLGIDGTWWPKVLLFVPGITVAGVCAGLVVSSTSWMINWRRANVARWHRTNDPQ